MDLKYTVNVFLMQRTPDVEFHYICLISDGNIQFKNRQYIYFFKENFPDDPLVQFYVHTCIYFANLYKFRYFLKFRVIFVAFFLQVWRKVYFQYLLLERNIPVIAATEYFSGQNGRLLNLDISNRGLPVCQDSVH